MIPRIVEMTSVSKQYGALRPLRIERLEVSEGEQVAIVGLDQPAAEVFVNLITGASLPDTGTVRVLGRSTAEIGDSAEWLTLLDRFGIVTERAVLLEALSAIQNIAMPFSLDIEPPPADIRERAVGLARETGLAEHAWDQPAARLDAPSRVRLRLARALAFDPAVLLLEHPSASLADGESARFGADLREVAGRRGVAALTLTADRGFAGAAAVRVLTLEPATGRLKESRLGMRGFWS